MSRAFTLLEILVAIAIALILIAITIGAFASIRDTEAVRRDASAIASLLETARIHTLSSKENTRYGVRIDEPDILMFKGESFDPANVQSKETLHTSVSIDTLDLANSSDTIVFDRLTGETNNHGTIVLVSTANNASSSITINPTGTLTVDH